MKLKNIVNKFHHQHLTKEHQSELQDYQILHNILDDVFPAQSSIGSFLEILSTLKNCEALNMYSLTTLPLHIHNDEWMFYYIKNLLNSCKTLYNIDPKHISNFINHDPEYISRREQYEQAVFYTEMSRLLNSIQSDNLDNPKSTPYRIKNSVNAVEDFHQTLVNHLTKKLNFEQHTVEIYLEKNSDLWRSQLMNLAFINQCINPLKPCKVYIGEKQYLNIVYRVYAQKTIWTKIEEFKYYQKHSPIIDELGTHTNAMKMRHEDAENTVRVFKEKYNDITNHLFNNIKVITNNHHIDK